MDGDESNVPSTSDLCQQLKTIVGSCVAELCGGAASSEWREAVEKLASSTVSLTCSKRTTTNDDLRGKPWEIEIRTALSYFHRYKDGPSGILAIVSDLGLLRTITSPHDLGRLLQLTLEQATRENGICLDIRCNDAGVLCVATERRLLALRKSGRLPCPHCCQWLSGDKGLWWHIQERHAQDHSEAMTTAANTMTVNALVLYSSNTKCPASLQSDHDAHIFRQPTATPLGEPVTIAQQGDTIAMQELIRKGFDPSKYIDSKGANLLLWAAGAGQLDMAKLLIQSGSCDPNFAQRGRRGFRGRTALHWAARNGHLDMVKYLVEDHGVCLEAMTADGTTAFCWAAWQGHERVLEYLAGQRCNVSSANSFGCNAALWAAQGNGSPDVIRWLDSIGCSCLVLNDNNHGVLHKAAQRGKRDLCGWFLEQRLKESLAQSLCLDMIRPDSDGCLPSDLAGMEGHESLAEYLVMQERIILRGAFIQQPPAPTPVWLMNSSPMAADSVWEPFAGVTRLRCAAMDFL